MMPMPSIVPGRLVAKVFLLFSLLLLLPWGATTFATLTAAHQNLAPEALLRLQAVGRTLAEPIERALGYGIALDGLIGMDEFLDQALASTEGLHSIAMRDVTGRDLYRRAARSGPDGVAPEAGRSVSVPVSLDEEVVAELVLTEQESEVNRLYAPAIRGLAIALILSLLLGYETIRFLTTLLLLAPLRLGQRLIRAIGAGDLRSVAGSAAMGGEIGALLTVANRLARRILDRCEDIVFYAREVRIGLTAAEAAKVDQIAQGATRGFRTAPTVHERHPALARPLRDFAGFLATTALILQLPAFLAAARPLGHTVPIVALAIGAGLALILGPAWYRICRLIGPRLATLGALAVTLMPLMPWDGLSAEAELALRVLGFVCVISVLRPPEGPVEPDEAQEEEGDALRWLVHGLAFGFGLMALWSGPEPIFWPAVLLILAYGLLMLSHRERAEPPEPVPRVRLPVPGPRIVAAMTLLLLGYAYAVGRGLEMLRAGDEEWTEPVFFLGAMAAGLGVIRLLPRDPSRALAIATAGLLLLPLMIVPMILWGGSALLLQGFAAGAVMGLSELACVRLLRGIAAAATLVRVTTWIGALLGLVFVSGLMPRIFGLDLAKAPLVAAAVAGVTWLFVTLAERRNARHG